VSLPSTWPSHGRGAGAAALRARPWLPRAAGGAWLWNLPPSDRRYYPLHAECVQLGSPFCPQVGHTGPRCPSEPGRPIPYLDTVALEFPELVIVGGHIDYPWTAEISLATKYPSVYIDTSAYKVGRYPRELADYLRGHGRYKVLFGSNHPAWLAADCLQDLPSLQLEDQTADLFLHGNAERVFGLTGAPAPAWTSHPRKPARITTAAGLAWPAVRPFHKPCAIAGANRPNATKRRLRALIPLHCAAEWGAQIYSLVMRPVDCW
jgi:hypothetical protein